MSPVRFPALYTDLGIGPADDPTVRLRLKDLVDVDLLTSLTDGNVLKYEAPGWRNRTITNVLANGNLTDLSDVDFAGLANNDLLKYNSTDSEWQNFPIQMTRLKLSTTTHQTISNNTTTGLVWNSTIRDDGNWHPGDAPNADRKVKVDADGVYFVRTQVRWAANATGYRQVQVLVNGSVVDYNTIRLGAAPATDPTVMQSTMMEPLSADDFLSVWVKQTSGGNLDVEYNRTYFSVVRVR